MTASGKSTTVNRLNILRGGPYIARFVRTVRGRIQENLPIVILERHQVLILMYVQNVQKFGNNEAKFKSIMDGTPKQIWERLWLLTQQFAFGRYLLDLFDIHLSQQAIERPVW
jgi:hypothetical protein